MKALVPIPTQVDRFIRLPSVNRRRCLAALRAIHSARTFRLVVSRPALPGLRREGQGCVPCHSRQRHRGRGRSRGSRSLFRSRLERRKRGDVIRLKCEASMPEELRRFVARALKIGDDVVLVDGLLGLSETVTSSSTGRSCASSLTIRAFPERIRDNGGDCFAAIRQKDLIVHHPYESFDVVVQFLRQAARGPRRRRHQADALSHQRGLADRAGADRVRRGGKIGDRARRTQARFDEEANIRWARDLERAGVKVVYGFVELKTPRQAEFGRAPGGRGAALLLPLRHRQLPRHHRPNLHRPLAFQRRSRVDARCHPSSSTI